VYNAKNLLRLKKSDKKKKWKILGGGGVHHRPSGMEIPGGWGG